MGRLSATTTRSLSMDLLLDCSVDWSLSLKTGEEQEILEHSSLESGESVVVDFFLMERERRVDKRRELLDC